MYIVIRKHDPVTTAPHHKVWLLWLHMIIKSPDLSLSESTGSGGADCTSESCWRWRRGGEGGYKHGQEYSITRKHTRS